MPCTNHILARATEAADSDEAVDHQTAGRLQIQNAPDAPRMARGELRPRRTRFHARRWLVRSGARTHNGGVRSIRVPVKVKALGGIGEALEAEFLVDTGATDCLM